MLTTLLEITMAMLTVYGLYCLIINLTYTFFCKDKKNICIAFFKKSDSDIFSNILLAKKAFMGRTKTIILVDSEADGNTVKEIASRNPDSEVFRAERVEKS
ncbi:MAG: hypothetical protein IJ292_03845 [Clostridia bacterium]|jgi:hypothetical protein|nr:hypothetical protein [Clostridia bacterium]